MADSFQNPTDQAALNALQARLAQIETEIRGGQQQLAAEVSAMREQQRATTSGSRSTATAVPSLHAEVTAINEQVVSYERLNALITERIGLEARAATAARETALAAGGSTAGAGVVAPSSGKAGHVVLPQGMNAMEFATLAPLAARAGAAQKEMAATGETLVMSEAEVQAQLERSAAAMVEYDQTLAKTGALSGAALTALADGTITVRELGNQVGQTIAKFGGWTLAATAVFGVIGAVGELKKGAVDASSAVQALTKFIPPGSYNPGQARQDIISQAQSTATPIKDVGDATQQFAKVFKDQGDVFTATHVALTAAKLDNISLADSYRYLVAIVQEAGLHVNQLPGIFDSVTAAQDKLGGRVAQLLPALAGSAGAVKTAGGDINQLLGLQTLTEIRTGLPGTNIATAYARGATNFFPTAGSRGVLSRFGISPDQGFTQALIEAITKGQQQGLSEGEKRELAQAFFGPRFGSRIVSLFNAPLTGEHSLQQSLQETSAGANSGLAETQLGKTMGQANNQLALLKVNLQAIGAELTGSGITTPFSVMLQFINKMLEASGDLLKVWSSLPGPLKEAASLSAVAFGGLALARRLNVGGLVAGEGAGAVRGAVGGFLSPSSATVAERRARQYATAVEDALAGQQASASTKLLQSQIRLAAANDELNAVRSTEGASAKAVADAEARQAAAALAAANADAELAALTSETMAARVAEMRAAAGMGGASVLGGAAAGALLGRGGAAAGEAMISEEVAGSLVGFEGLQSAVTKASSGLSFLASNAIPLAIAAFVAFDMAKQSIGDTQKGRTDAYNKILNANTPQEALAAYNTLNSGTGSSSFRIPLIGAHVPNPFAIISNELSGDRAQAAADLRERNYGFQATDTLRQHAETVAARVKQQQLGGHYEQALKTLQGDIGFQSLGRLPDFQQSYDQLQSQLQRQQEAKSVGGKSDPFASWSMASKDLKNQLGPKFQAIANSAKVFGNDSEDLKALSAGYFYAVEKFGSNTSDQQAMQILAQAQTDLVTSVDKRVTDLMNLAKMSTTDKGQQGYYTKALDTVSKSQSEIRSMADAAAKLPGADVGKIRSAEQQALGLVAQRRATALEGLLGLQKSETDLSASKVPGVGPEADLRRAEVTLQGLGRQLSTAHKYGADAQQLNTLQTQYNQEAITVLQDRLNFDQQLGDALMQFAQSQTADPVQQAAIGVQKLGQLYAQLKAAGAPQTQLLGVLSQQQQQITAGISAQVSQEQAATDAQLSQMNIGQPQQVQLQNAVSTAQQQLNFLLSQPSSRVNPAQISQAFGKLYQAQGALAQFWIQEGRSLIQAQTALSQGQTFDPIAIANLALQGAEKLLAYDKSHNVSMSQITQDQAQVANDYKATLEARWQKQLAFNQYLADTYQITSAQEINRLKKIIADMVKHHASYQEILQARQQLYGLMFGQGDLNLNTGNMHMPSTYEVKSAIINGRNATRRKANAGLLADVKTNVTMTVMIERDVDLHKFTKAINDALGTSVNGIAQAAGLV